ncbi:MAG: putative phage protein (TIGR02218 family) [Alphaproteobacteria bacterium]|jgi:uncharacterized phage protein (TIGR02218 family)
MITDTKLIQLIVPHHIFYITLYDREIVVNDIIYKPDHIIEGINMGQTANLDPNTLHITLIRKPLISYDGGIIKLFDYNVTTQQMAQAPCFTGKIHKATMSDITVKLYAKGIRDLLNYPISRSFSTQCQAIWGDNRCGIDKNLHKQVINITNMTDNFVSYTVISGTMPAFYNPFLQDSVNRKIPIINHNPDNQTFQTEPHFTFSLNQHYDLYAGCRKNTDNCHKFNNFNNFLGFYI